MEINVEFKAEYNGETGNTVIKIQSGARSHDMCILKVKEKEIVVLAGAWHDILELKPNFDSYYNFFTSQGVDLESKKTKFEKPNEGDGYYLINESGDIYYMRWNDVEIDHRRWEQGNGFHTKEEGEFEREKRKLDFRAKCFAGRNGWEADWSDLGQKKWNMNYDCYYKKMYKTVNFEERGQGVIYFQTEKDARQFYKENEADILKYWFNTGGNVNGKN